nr:DnaA regulatory inactivator Hda [Legionella feeleii]
MFNQSSRQMNRQLALAIQLNDEATLTDFCWGSNTLLQQQLAMALQGKGERLFTIWGNPGCGKSHLLQGCCQAMSINAAATIYLPLKILKEWGPESIEGIAEQDLIAIDDIDAIANDTAWEEALFHLYNKVRDNGKTILLITCQHPPSSSPIHLPDLRSRLAWSLVVQLNELEDDLKIKTLQQHASKRGFKLPISVGQFLLNRCARNMHDLHAILDQLDEASLIAQRKITIPFVKSILSI